MQRSRRANMKLIQRAPVIDTTQFHGFHGGSLHAPYSAQPLWGFLLCDTILATRVPGNQLPQQVNWGSLRAHLIQISQRPPRADWPLRFNFCISQWLYHSSIPTVSLALQTCFTFWGPFPFSLEYKSFFCESLLQVKAQFSFIWKRYSLIIKKLYFSWV